MPPVHVYVLAPPPERLVVPPMHTAGTDTLMVITGSGFTVIPALAALVLVHPALLVPATL